MGRSRSHGLAMRPSRWRGHGLSRLEGAKDVAFSVLEVGDGTDARYHGWLDHLVAASFADTALCLREILDLDGVDIGNDGLATDPTASLSQRAIDSWLAVGPGGDQPVVDRTSFPAVDSPTENLDIEALGTIEVGAMDLEVDDATHACERSRFGCARRLDLRSGRLRQSAAPSRSGPAIVVPRRSAAMMRGCMCPGTGCQQPCCGPRRHDCSPKAARPPVTTLLLILGRNDHRSSKARAGTLGRRAASLHPCWSLIAGGGRHNPWATPAPLPACDGGAGRGARPLGLASSEGEGRRIRFRHDKAQRVRGSRRAGPADRGGSARMSIWNSSVSRPDAGSARRLTGTCSRAGKSGQAAARCRGCRRGVGLTAADAARYARPLQNMRIARLCKRSEGQVCNREWRDVTNGERSGA